MVGERGSEFRFCALLNAGEVWGGGFEAVECVDLIMSISEQSLEAGEGEEIGGVPVAPASNSASACTSPNPLAAPETRTTLPTRLNSGKSFVVPRYEGVLPLCSAADSASGGAGGPRVCNLGSAENVRLA